METGLAYLTENILKCLLKTLLIRYRDDISLEKFTLIVRLSDDPKFESNVYKCLKYAGESYVKELKFRFCCP